MSIAPKLLFPCLVILLISHPLPAAIIGTNVPSQSLTAERIATLPAADRSAWQKYLANSIAQSKHDRTAFHQEIRKLATNAPALPPATRGTRGMELNRSPEWYASAAAQELADNIVSFQTPAGGWSKNLDMTQHRRAVGEMYAQGNLNQYSSATDLDLPHDPNWNYVGTFDNGATITQLRFLAKVIPAAPKARSKAYREAFLHGLNYIFASQFPNGGWPQVWPLQGGYHDGVTFNDGAMISILELLSDVVEKKAEFAFVPASVRRRAAASLNRGTACVVAAQIVSAGQRTAWGQQYDCLTLTPGSARNYEMPSISSGESADVMLFLMRLPNPNTNVIAAIHAAAAWFERVALRDVAYQRVGADGRHLVAAPGHAPIWSRYYDLNTNQPIFGDRDKSIHDTVEEISRERRDGYAWFNEAPTEALKRYAAWKLARQ